MCVRKSERVRGVEGGQGIVVFLKYRGMLIFIKVLWRGHVVLGMKRVYMCVECLCACVWLLSGVL